VQAIRGERARRLNLELAFWLVVNQQPTQEASPELPQRMTLRKATALCLRVLAMWLDP
jgi:hypothetical protein